MIGIAGTLILLPLAILALAFGLLRFGVRTIGALVAEAFARIARRLAFHA